METFYWWDPCRWSVVVWGESGDAGDSVGQCQSRRGRRGRGGAVTPGNALTTTLGSQVAPKATPASSSWDSRPPLVSLVLWGQPRHSPEEDEAEAGRGLEWGREGDCPAKWRLLSSNKWLCRTCTQHAARRSAPPSQTVIGSSNPIYVSLEIEILTFALCSWDFTAHCARLGTNPREFYGRWVMAWLE